MRLFASILYAIVGGLTIWLCGEGSTFAQSLPPLTVNLNTNAKLHVVWPMPTVGSILQQPSSLSSTGAWQASSLNVNTKECNCQVLAPTSGTDLLMLDHAETWAFGTNAPNNHSPGWASVGLARSLNGGLTWTNREQIITGCDPVPTTNPPVAQIYGAVEPGAIIASNFIYCCYAYFPSTPATNPAGPVIQIARSALANDGSRSTRTSFFNGAFSPTALGGPGSQIVPKAWGCTRPTMPWPAFSSYLNAYVLVFLANEGWFFSTSTNLVTWSSQVEFFTAPNNEFTSGLPTDENVILVTPGNPAQGIGQTGIVLYAHTPAWTGASHELWSRPFTFRKNP